VRVYKVVNRTGAYSGGSQLPAPGLPGRVLTDRAFLAEPKTMLWAFILGGAVAGAFIILFGLLGVFGAAQAITNPSRRAPAKINGFVPHTLVSAASHIPTLLRAGMLAARQGLHTRPSLGVLVRTSTPS